MKYPGSLKAWALILHFYSHRAFEDVRKSCEFNLSSIETLRAWTKMSMMTFLKMSSRDTTPLAREVLVFMSVGNNFNNKLPVAYFLLIL